MKRARSLLTSASVLGVVSPVSTALQEASPAVVLESTSGAVERLRLEGFELVVLEGRDVAFLRFEGLEPVVGSGPAERDRAAVSLVDGDRLRASVSGGEGDVLSLELVANVRMDLEVDRLRSLVFEARVSGEALAGLAPAPSGDVLFWLRPGGSLDRVPGTLVAFGDEGPRLEGDFGARTFPWDEVAALFIEPLGDQMHEAPVPARLGLRPGAAAILELVDGGRLRGRLINLAPRGCLLEHAPGRDVYLPLGAVAELVAADGRVRFLSDLVPTRADEGSPFGDDLGLVWRHRMDASVTGAPLRAGGATWRRGIGVHAPSRLSFALDGGWSELRGACAIDDQVLLLSTRGSVIFRVLVDGEQRWSSGVVHAGEPVLDLPPVSLAGASELVLEVDMSTDFHVGDRADWLRPLLVRVP